VDDEQGPWWTRPPEPGPRVRLRDEDRDTKTSASRASGTSPDSPDGEGDPYDTEIFRPDSAAPEPPRAYQPPASSEPWADRPTQAAPPPGPHPEAAPGTGRHQLPPAPGYQPSPTPQGPSPYTPDPGVPTQGGWPEATPVPGPPTAFQQPAFQQPVENAATMPLPLIGEDDFPADGTQPNPLAAAAPAPEAPPAPKPPKPVIRRVAAPEPPPTRPAKKAKSVLPDDRNAYAPPQNGDIWATFSGPIPLPDEVLAERGQASQAAATRPAPPRPMLAPDPAGGAGGDDESPLKKFLTVQVPEARFVLIAIAGGLVVLLIVLVALLSGGSGSTPSTSTPSSKPTALAGDAAKNLEEVTRVSASKTLQKAGANAGGTVVEAWQWDDKNGTNLVAAIKVPTSKGKTTLKVVHVDKVSSNDPKVVRVMVDPDLPQCSGGKAGGQAAFAKGGMKIQDLNSDGYAEVIVGWSSRCGVKSNPSEAKLALITRGDKYIIRGSGVLKQSGDIAPSPAAKDWPKSFYNAVSKRYAELFFTPNK
jgi:hypothetical protein